MLCVNCDYEIFYNEGEFNYYLKTFHKRYDRGLYYNILLKILI